ncbi:MAG TPA: peptide-methionine (S)-S-oxide reductase MsrA [Candidatus Eisenbacteria bacterium]|nr:peptide-methionine (S)-S-oxide reductase MsrA [Candidatus Eisenbacteria bacterium]
MRTAPFAALLALIAAAAPAPRPAAAAPAAAPAPRIETAVFAGGCFWCMETQFEGRPGILDVVSGYAGGHVKNPSYEQVGTGLTGHRESVQVRFDASKVGYAQLLDLFWHSIDPTQNDGQFCDRGPEYRSAIFYAGEEQRRLALASKRQLEASGVLHAPIVTDILPAGPFYRAEEYHQDFWKKDWERYHTYREGCGRDQRLAELWGSRAVKPVVY